MNNFSKSEINKNKFNENEVSYILETKKRQFFPQMKNFLINKFINSKDNTKLIENKSKINAIINIKNNPNFKFHIFHDKKGKIRELDKPCKRSLKMTTEKIRDLKIMSKINKIKDPELIKIYKSIL